MVNVAVLGTGRIGKIHTKNLLLSRHVFLKRVVDPFLDKEWAYRLPSHVKCSKNEEDIFCDKEIDAVIICSPVEYHVLQIIQAAEKGKHIFCEKPLAMEIEPTMQALSSVKKNNVKLQIGFNRRFDKNFSEIAKQIRNNQLGNIFFVRITSRDPEIPPMEYLKGAGGLFRDMTIHDFDMLRFLVQSEVKQIYVRGAVMIDKQLETIGDIDTAIIQVEFENGVLGYIDNSRQATYGYDQRVEVLGSKGGVAAENNLSSNVVNFTKQGIRYECPQYFFFTTLSASL